MNLERNRVIYKACTCFELFGWTWGADNEIYPSLNEIEKVFIDLEESARKNKGLASTGRLRVDYYKNKKEEWFEYNLNL